MEAPPNFSGAPKKSKTGLIIGGIALLVCLCCCGVCGLGGFAVKDVMKNGLGVVGCGIGIGQHRDALLSYAEAHGGKLPPANTWQDSIKPYLAKLPPMKKDQPFAIPGADDDFCDKANKTGLTLNDTLAGRKVDDIKDQMATILLFETPGTGRNKAGAWKEASHSTSPVIMMGQRRGWIRQPLKGEAGTKDETGKLIPVSTFGTKAGSIKIEE